MAKHTLLQLMRLGYNYDFKGLIQ